MKWPPPWWNNCDVRKQVCPLSGTSGPCTPFAEMGSVSVPGGTAAPGSPPASCGPPPTEYPYCEQDCSQNACFPIGAAGPLPDPKVSPFCFAAVSVVSPCVAPSF